MKYDIDWNCPAEKLRLVERIGIEPFNQAFAEYKKSLIVANVNGYDILRTTSARFGELFQVAGTSRAYRTVGDATEFAEGLTAQQPN